METLDWTKLAGNVVPDSGRIPYEPNKHLFKKVAFDVFQFNSSPVESLWILEDSDDGEQFLVAQYDDDAPGMIEVKSHWKALTDRKGENVTLMYKETPIRRFAATDYGFISEDVHIFQKALVEKLASHNTFVSELLKMLPKSTVGSLVTQYPELQSLATGPNEPEPNEPDWEDEAGQQDPGYSEEPNIEEPNIEDVKEDVKAEVKDTMLQAMKAIPEHSMLTREDFEEVLNSMYEEILEIL